MGPARGLRSSVGAGALRNSIIGTHQLSINFMDITALTGRALPGRPSTGSAKGRATEVEWRPQRRAILLPSSATYRPPFPRRAVQRSSDSATAGLHCRSGWRGAGTRFLGADVPSSASLWALFRFGIAYGPCRVRTRRLQRLAVNSRAGTRIGPVALGGRAIPVNRFASLFAALLRPPDG